MVSPSSINKALIAYGSSTNSTRLRISEDGLSLEYIETTKLSRYQRICAWFGFGRASMLRVRNFLQANSELIDTSNREVDQGLQKFAGKITKYNSLHWRIRHLTELNNPLIKSSKDLSGELRIAQKELDLKESHSTLQELNANLGGRILADQSKTLLALTEEEYKEGDVLGMTSAAQDKYVRLQVAAGEMHTQIFENIFLGTYRAFLNLDPNFAKEHSEQLVDAVEAIGDTSNPTIKKIAERIHEALKEIANKVLNISHVISVTRFKTKAQEGDWSRFEPNLEKGGITRTQIPIDDDAYAFEGIKEHLPNVFKEIDEARMQGKGVLVHCVMGKRRSAIVLIGYMMYSTGLSFDQVLKFVQLRRSVVDLKPQDKIDLEAYIISFRKKV